MPPILNAQGLTKAFGALPLFQDISFTVSEGNRIGLIGPNGAGKSTLLQILAGQIDADGGEVAPLVLQLLLGACAERFDPAEHEAHMGMRIESGLDGCIVPFRHDVIVIQEMHELSRCAWPRQVTHHARHPARRPRIPLVTPTACR